MYAGLWSDGRFAGVCTEMMNRREIEENAQFARTFDKPFDESQWKLFDEAARQTARATCPGCDGSCREAAGTKTDFCSIARYVAYLNEDGKHEEARRLFAALSPEARSWAGADLDAAGNACAAKLDFRTILARAEQLLA